MLLFYFINLELVRHFFFFIYYNFVCIFFRFSLVIVAYQNGFYDRFGEWVWEQGIRYLSVKNDSSDLFRDDIYLDFSESADDTMSYIRMWKEEKSIYSATSHFDFIG